jgi:hypothetical protein
MPAMPCRRVLRVIFGAFLSLACISPQHRHYVERMLCRAKVA